MDPRERGAPINGEPQYLDQRLFMQLLVLRCDDLHQVDATTQSVREGLEHAHVAAVLYEDLADPRGVGLLTWSTDPAHFVTKVRPALTRSHLGMKPDNLFTMIGRTYSSGYEKDLAHWLLRRPIEQVQREDCPWHIWYPLRRKGAFNRLDPKEQGSILREHGTIGHSFGAKDLGHDIRLACHGLDTHDNDFVIGLLGRELHPLSLLVQTMRRTRQTGEFMEQMGPFFVGHVRTRTTAALAPPA